MKTKHELDTLKKEVETLNKKLAELTAEELQQVAGGLFGLYMDVIPLKEEPTIEKLPQVIVLKKPLE